MVRSSLTCETEAPLEHVGWTGKKRSNTLAVDYVDIIGCFKTVDCIKIVCSVENIDCQGTVVFVETIYSIKTIG